MSNPLQKTDYRGRAAVNTQASSNTGQGRPIDLLHLERQTLGMKDLEAEVLQIFADQAEIYIKMMLNSCDVTNRIRAAHSLKGAARGIGAFHLADLAADVERPRHDGYDAVETEFYRVLDFIRQRQ